MAWSGSSPLAREGSDQPSSSTFQPSRSTGAPQASSKPQAGSWRASSWSPWASSATGSSSRTPRRTRLARALRLAAPLALLLLVAAAGVRADDDDDDVEVEDIEDPEEGGGGQQQQGPGWTEFNGVRIAITKEGDCRKAAEQGDTLFITHVGARQGENGQMVQFDGNGNEPMKVQLGEHRIIKGMEKGMYGMCAGETRSVLIPPHLGFDDPALRMNNKPVESGTMVMYQITLVRLEKEGEVDVWALINKWWSVVAFFSVLAGLVYWRHSKKSKRRSKKKKN